MACNIHYFSHAGSFKRQLKFVSVLVDSYDRLVADAVLHGDIGYAKSLADTYALAKDFRNTCIWYEWKCSSYENFVIKFHEFVRNSKV